MGWEGADPWARRPPADLPAHHPSGDHGRGRPAPLAEIQGLGLRPRLLLPLRPLLAGHLRGGGVRAGDPRLQQQDRGAWGFRGARGSWGAGDGSILICVPPPEPPRDAGRGAHQRAAARQVAQVWGRLLLHQRGLLPLRHGHLHPHRLLPPHGRPRESPGGRGAEQGGALGYATDVSFPCSPPTPTPPPSTTCAWPGRSSPFSPASSSSSQMSVP